MTRRTRHYERGEVLRNLGRFEAALKEYGLALATRPRDELAREGMARALEKLKRYAEAVEHIDEVLHAWPRDARVLRYRSHLYGCMGRADLALDDARQAMSIEPWNPHSHRRLAHAAADMDRWDEAIESAQNALAKEPRDQDTWWALGRVAETAGRVELARSAYREYLEIGPVDIWGVYALGRTLEGAERVETLERAVALDPSRSGPLLELADALASVGQPARAMESARAGVRSAKNARWAWMRCAKTAKRCLQLELLWSEIAEAREREPDESWLWVAAAEIAFERRDRDAQVACARKAMELSVDGADACGALANAVRGTDEAPAAMLRRASLGGNEVWWRVEAVQALLDVDRIDEARVLAERIVSERPREPHAWRAVGLVAARSGDASLLATVAGLARERPDSHPGQEALAHLSFAQENWTDAAAMYARARSTSAECCCAASWLGRARLREGSLDEARTLFNTSVDLDWLCGCAGARALLERELALRAAGSATKPAVGT